MIDSVVPTFLPAVQESIEILAVITFALSGLAAALRAGMDFVGVSASLLTAWGISLGGGIIGEKGLLFSPLPRIF